jgi:hypothetical protein
VSDHLYCARGQRDVNNLPLYVPLVEFQPSLPAWEYILVGDLRDDTVRPHIDTLVVARRIP